MTQEYVKSEYPLSDVTARIIAVAREVHLNFGAPKLEIKRLAN